MSNRALAKFWLYFTVTNGVVEIVNSFNVKNVLHDGSGRFTIQLLNPFSGVNYCVLQSGNAALFVVEGPNSPDEIKISTRNPENIYTDFSQNYAAGFGD